MRVPNADNRLLLVAQNKGGYTNHLSQSKRKNHKMLNSSCWLCLPHTKASSDKLLNEISGVPTKLFKCLRIQNKNFRPLKSLNL